MKLRLKILLMIAVIVGFIGLKTYNDEVTIPNNQVKYNVVLEGNSDEGKWIGSGVVIDSNGIILTAGHCVRDACEITITLNDGRRIKATGYFYDEKYDVGFVKIPVKGISCVYIGNSNKLQHNTKVFAIGNSGGIWDNNITKGLVYTVHFIRPAALRTNNEFIMVAINVYPGNSGGGVYYHNKLIGIVSMGGFGVAFIVPTSEIIPILKRLEVKYNGEV